MGGERGFPMLAMAAALAVGTVLVTVAVAVAGDGPLVHSAGTPPARGTTAAAAQPSLLEAQQWLNTAPLRAEELRGKAMLVNFWTYSCINSLRALPYVRAWADKYRDQGLVVVGVHTPEFEFEKTLPISVRRRAPTTFGIRWRPTASLLSGAHLAMRHGPPSISLDRTALSAIGCSEKASTTNLND